MSTTINLDNLDPETLGGLRREAARRGVDVNELACELLREKFGPAQPTEGVSRPFHGTRELDDFAGTWSEKDFTEFMAAIADFEKVDEELWR